MAGLFVLRPSSFVKRRSSVRAKSAIISQSARAWPGGGDGSAHALDAAVGVGEGAVLLRKAGRGQDHVGVDVGLVEEDVLGDEELELLDGVAGVRQVRLAHQRVLAHHVPALDLAGQDAVHHLGRGQAGHGGQRYPPGRLELRAYLGIGHRLVGGVEARHAADVGAALDVVLPSQRVQPGARPADVAAQQRQVGQRQGVVRAVRALADAHAPVHRRGLGPRVDARRAADVVGRHAGDRLGPLRRFFGQAGGVFHKTFGACRDERLVVELLGHDHLRHRVEQGGVGAGFLAQPQLGEAGHLGLPRIDDDQPGAVLAHGLLQEGGNDRMCFGRVRADHHEAFQVGHLGNGVAHGGGADGQLQARDAAGVA